MLTRLVQKQTTEGAVAADEAAMAADAAVVAAVAAVAATVAAADAAVVAAADVATDNKHQRFVCVAG